MCDGACLCVRVSVRLWICVCEGACVYVCMWAHVRASVCLCACVVCVCVCVCVCDVVCGRVWRCVCVWGGGGFACVHGCVCV